MISERVVVTAQQMQALEEWIFRQGLPVAALMERAGWCLGQAIHNFYPLATYPQIGILTGSGHNGADSLVVARELLVYGYQVKVYLATTLAKLKPLTRQHWDYYQAIGGEVVTELEALASVDLLVDGLLGVGLTRDLAPGLQTVLAWANGQTRPVVSLDLPSGLHSDTGVALGMAIRAQRTLCLGYWKQGLFQETALEYCGDITRLDLTLPDQALQDVLRQPFTYGLTASEARSYLPLNRASNSHKYSIGKLLIIAGSRAFPGAAILAGLAAKASGIGLVGLAVPASLRDIILNYLPDAIIYPCPETTEGRIAQLTVNLEDFTAIACGPGLGDCPELVAELLKSSQPVVLDADGLNSLGIMQALGRSAPTVITPHLGEFRRLFPEIDPSERFTAVRQAAAYAGATVVLKGARTVIAQPNGETWVNLASTPALARAGSGDVLTGLIGGLIAQKVGVTQAALGAVWWHSHAGRILAQERSVLGVDPLTLAQQLTRCLPITYCSLASAR